MTLKTTVKVIWRHWVKEWIKTIMMYHNTKFELPNAFHKNYMIVQSCVMSTFIDQMMYLMFTMVHSNMVWILLQIWISWYQCTSMFTKILNANKEPTYPWKKLMFFRLKRVNLGTSQAKFTKKIAFVIIFWADIVVSAISYFYKTQNYYRYFHKNQTRCI